MSTPDDVLRYAKTRRQRKTVLSSGIGAYGSYVPPDYTSDQGAALSDLILRAYFAGAL